MMSVFLSVTVAAHITRWLAVACFIALAAISYRNNPEKRQWVLCLVAAAFFVLFAILGL